MSDDKVDSPAHYGGRNNPFETYKVFEAWFGDVELPPVVSAYVFNAIKYLSRAGKKPGESLIEDIQKARWYLDHVIMWLESKEKE